MKRNQFNDSQKEILGDFQITATPTIKSLSALFFSGLISTFGIYSILLSVGIEGNTMYKAIGIFILILIVADTFKRGSLVKYYNSILKVTILSKGKTKKMQLGVSILALAFMTVFDIVGSFSTANYVEQSYQEFQATNSKEFKLLEDNAKNGVSELSLYSQELTTWTDDKKLAYQNCNDQWNGYKAKYKAKCKKEWDNKKTNAKPVKPSNNGSVSVADYKNVKEGANEDFLSEYIFYIILFLSMALTMLLQYTTISEIQDSRDEIEEELNDMTIGILQDRLRELETNLVHHETERSDLISQSDKEEKRLNRDFEERGKAIGLLSMGKAVESRGETVKRIANNSNFPTSNTKAGKVVNPFHSEKTEPKHQEPKQEAPKKDNWIQSLDTIEILARLYDARDRDGSIEANQKLNTKSSVININNRGESQAFSNASKELTGLGIIELRGNKGYFALVSYDTAIKMLNGSPQQNQDFDLGDF